MSTPDYFEIVWRRKRLIAVGVIVGLIAAVAIGRPDPRPPASTYSASQTLIVNGTPAERPVSTALYGVLATESEIPARVAAALGGGESALSITERVAVIPDPDLGTISLAIEGEPDADAAMNIIDTYAAELATFANELAQGDLTAEIQALEAREVSLTTQVQDLETRLAERPEDAVLGALLTTAIAQLSFTVNNLEELRLQELNAEPEIESLRPAQAQEMLTGGFEDPLGFAGRLLVGIFVGLILSIALAFVLHRFDTRIYDRAEAEAAFGLPVIAEIPRLPRRWRNRRSVITHYEPGALASEAYRSLRTTVSALHAQRAIQADDGELAATDRVSSGGLVLLVASPGPSEGKSTTVANLAAAFANAGQSALVVSGDLRRPTVHEYLGAAGEPGLGDAVRRGISPSDLEALVQPTALKGVDLLPHGRVVDNPGETLAASRALILAGRETHDVVVIDSPALLLGNDVGELVPVANSVVLIARAGRTDAEVAARSREAIDRLVAPTLGVVLIGSRQVLKRQKYAYRRYSVPSAERYGRLRWGRRRGPEPPPDDDPLGPLPLIDIEPRPVHEDADADAPTADARTSGEGKDGGSDAGG